MDNFDDLLHQDNNSNCVIIMMYIKETASATNQIKHGSFSYISLMIFKFRWCG